MEGKINNVRNDLVDDISKQITNTITDIPEDIDNLRNVYLHIDAPLLSGKLDHSVVSIVINIVPGVVTDVAPPRLV